MFTPVRTATASIALDEHGLVCARIYPGATQTVVNARENLRAAIELRRGVRRPILVDISGCEPLEPRVRRCYTGKNISTSFTAIAILVEGTSFGKMIANIYLQIASPGIPAKLFHDRLSALAWLRAFVPAHVGAESS